MGDLQKKITKKQKEKEAKFSIMERIAKEANLTYDGGDNRLFYDEDQIHVYASDMTKKEYLAMEKEINSFRIKKKAYEIYTWNDSSGYDYWSQDHNDSNYIQITVRILDLNKVNTDSLKKDVIKAYNKFSSYDNRDYHDFSSNDSEEESI